MRPKKNDDEKLRHAITLRLDDDQFAAVKKYEKDHGLKPTDQARLGLLRFLKSEGYFWGGKGQPSL